MAKRKKINPDINRRITVEVQKDKAVGVYRCMQLPVLGDCPVPGLRRMYLKYSIEKRTFYLTTNR